jgi:cytoskeletal protein RodZ
MAKNKLQRKKPVRASLLLSALGIVILAGVASYWLTHRHQLTNSASSGTLTKKAPNTVDYSSGKTDNSATDSLKDTTTKDGTDNTTLNTPSTAPDFSATISRANASGNSITVAANVNGTTTGTCVFSFASTDGGTVLKRGDPEPVTAGNQSSFCAPQTVTMPSSGTWYVSLTVTNNSKVATAKWQGSPPVTN